jgi:hypothetical protein
LLVIDAGTCVTYTSGWRGLQAPAQLGTADEGDPARRHESVRRRTNLIGSVPLDLPTHALLAAADALIDDLSPTTAHELRNPRPC